MCIYKYNMYRLKSHRNGSLQKKPAHVSVRKYRESV